MRRTLQKLLTVGALCLSSLGVTGCWDYQKINDRAQIIGIAIDPIEEQSKLLTFTFQIPVFDTGGSKGQAGGGAGGGSSQGGARTTFRNFTVQAQGVSDAITKTQMHYDKMLYLGNVQTVVLNQHLGGDQVKRVVTEMIRIPSLDKLAWIIVTPESALDILHAPSSTAPADSIDRVLGSNIQQHGMTIRTRLWEFWRDERSIGIQPHTGLVKTTSEGLQVYGLQAFDNMGAHMELPPSDTLYFNFLNARVQRVAIWFQDGQRTFEAGEMKSKAKLSVSMKGGTPVLHAKIRASGVVLQDESNGMEQLTDAEMRRYEGVMERQIQAESVRVLRGFQKNRMDAYGFGECLFLHNPSTQRFIEKQWPDAFEKAKPDVQVKVTLLRKGSLM